ncbi:r-phenyllactate dehydratase small subunit [Leminorella grimontii]|uniref:R-phenyllactate dehydratase small subunit n=1 Tax=Leminorella grimontii TaxID=82981 RepID=A0AAV5N4Q5_9GAMM|nr:2-hydroxyacyl-CoA dehydratase family protein [Leminorella grimontii]KFC92841.1 BadD family benzoyl-CoA reductase subunit [Leminorella grimontii ATCC 33999 = DSM 5078]GKX56724.1 r-phenyllactate dehydratase small subunit [Leminorella grimontii]
MNALTDIFERLQAVVDNPVKQLDGFIRSGKKVVGCFPEYTPNEIVYAAGMVPFGVWGAEGREISEAKKYFPPFYCALALSSLEMGLDTALNKLSAALIPTLCDTLKCLGQNWKSGVPQVPFIQLVHPQNRNTPAGVAFLVEQYKKVAKQLETLSGQAVTEESLKNAISLFNLRRAALREFSSVAAQYPQTITPQMRNTVIKSGYFMDVLEHIEAVREIIARCRALPQEEWSGHRVVVTGIIADSPSILQILADNNMAIVADEVAHESRQFRQDVPEDCEPYEAMARQIAELEGCSLLFDPEKKRGGMLVDMVKKNNADGVVYLLTKFCDPEEFDAPIVKKHLDKAGIPSIIIEIDQQTKTYEQARTALQTFADVLSA